MPAFDDLIQSMCTIASKAKKPVRLLKHGVNLTLQVIFTPVIFFSIIAAESLDLIWSVFVAKPINLLRANVTETPVVSILKIGLRTVINNLGFPRFLGAAIKTAVTIKNNLLDALLEKLFSNTNLVAKQPLVSSSLSDAYDSDDEYSPIAVKRGDLDLSSGGFTLRTNPKGLTDLGAMMREYALYLPFMQANKQRHERRSSSSTPVLIPSASSSSLTSIGYGRGVRV